MRILVVEDDLEAQRYLVQGLKESGHVVDEAGDGETGLSLALSRPYDIAVIDRMLPGLDGLKVVAEMINPCKAVPVYDPKKGALVLLPSQTEIWSWVLFGPAVLKFTTSHWSEIPSPATSGQITTVWFSLSPYEAEGPPESSKTPVQVFTVPAVMLNC